MVIREELFIMKQLFYIFQPCFNVVDRRDTSTSSFVRFHCDSVFFSLKQYTNDIVAPCRISSHLDSQNECLKDKYDKVNEATTLISSLQLKIRPF
jgi:hypothetical protein